LEQVEELNRAKAATDIAVNFANFIIDAVNDILFVKFGFPMFQPANIIIYQQQATIQVRKTRHSSLFITP
jgi:hypothetical protein